MLTVSIGAWCPFREVIPYYRAKQPVFAWVYLRDVIKIKLIRKG
jgi:hypothetical protein